MRIGPQMALAVSIVKNNPGCTKLFVAARVHHAAASGKNNAYGYDPVNRAIRAGLIVARRQKSGKYELTVARMETET